MAPTHPHPPLNTPLLNYLPLPLLVGEGGEEGWPIPSPSLPPSPLFSQHNKFLGTARAAPLPLPMWVPQWVAPPSLGGGGGEPTPHSD
jgi:hypothetical protein